MIQKNKMMKITGVILAVALLAGTLPVKASAAGNFTNETYYYGSSKDGEYADTSWRTKGCALPDTKGYTYVFNAYDKASKVRLRGCLHNSSNGTRTNTDPCSRWSVIPMYQHSSLYNWYNLSSYNEVKLRVSTPEGTGSTGGYWSPDCSKVYTIIGD